MDKKYIALGILFLCFASLILGILAPKQQETAIEQKTENSFLTIENTIDKIALLNIEGPIHASAGKGYWSDEFNIENFLTTIDKLEKDNKVKAVIIRINSPGGTVAASQDIYDAILRLREKKPVVASLADVAASGGYYIASAADRIVAQRGTMTGSIGVILNFPDLTSLSEKIGVSANVIKSGKYKDAGSIYRKMSGEEKLLFQSSVDNAYEQFISAIKKGRIDRKDDYKTEKKILSINTLKQYADGRVMLGEEAYKLGFVDNLGSMHEAKLIANKMTGINKQLPIVPYNKMNALRSLLIGMESKFSLPIKNVLPFSVFHNFQPLMILE